jgi:2-C-methyl-D-erythritol 4-phosphate cytidylyltransferase
MKVKQTWLVLPAAGIGSRMKADRPKQYLEMTVNGSKKTVIEYTLDTVLAYSGIYKVVVVVTQGDPYWQEISQARGYDKDPRILVVAGGSERCYSVLNALTAISAIEQKTQVKANEENENENKDKHLESTWVAVHDVARPCLSYADLDKLFSAVEDYPDGGILAVPVRDTMKRGLASNVNGSRIEHTVEREQLWHALTPQMFPLNSLLNNLQSALAEGFEVTDEASAMEHAGAQPVLVSGRSDNLKITRPEDLKLAEFYLNNFCNYSGSSN